MPETTPIRRFSLVNNKDVVLLVIHHYLGQPPPSCVSDFDEGRLMHYGFGKNYVLPALTSM